MAETRIPLIFGTMTIGVEGKSGIRSYNKQECQELIDTFLKHGHTELDTARTYGEGTTEQVLAELDLKDASLDTKVYPVNPGDHAPKALRETFLASLKSLGKKVRALYLHAPDRSTPFEETLEEVNKLHKEGLFEIFALSNFASWEVAEVVGICKAKGWVQPTLYQVMYNAITREMEPELLPCVRKFGLRLVIYNPLAGGFFAGKLASVTDAGPKGGRFDPNASQGAQYRARYVNEGYLEALEYLKDVSKEHNIRLTEMALRWVQHHSVLTPEDGVIIGASSVAQLEENCQDSAKGPLPQALRNIGDEGSKPVVVLLRVKNGLCMPHNYE
ncbi:Aldo/keto reductase [Mycena floridula]|nr:Aldo/keto reductase [Mycena floridula]